MRRVGSAPLRKEPPSKRAKTSRTGNSSKPSARYQRILEDEMYEEQIQRMYSPATTSNTSTRTLPLHVQKQRDGQDFKLPSLHSLCLELTAKHFLTHVLPSREVFDKAAATGARGNVKQRAAPQPARPKPRIVSRGIGGRPIMDEESAAGADFVPSDDSDEGGDGVGIAAAPRRMSTRRGPASSTSSVNASALSSDDLRELHADNSQLLKLLPPPTKIKLLRLLRTVCPESLTRQTLVTYFIHGQPEVELDSAMTLFVQQPNDINLVLRSIGPADATSSMAQVPLRRLSLSGLTRLAPKALASLFIRCRHLEEVVLKGCVRVDAECIEALLKYNAKHLRVLNANFTEIGAAGVEAVVARAPKLQTLKVANVLGLTDKVVPDLLMRASKVAQAADPPYAPLEQLRSLKIRGAQMGDASLTALFGLLKIAEAPLARLDVASIDLTGHRADSLIKFLGYPMPVIKSADDPRAATEMPNLRQMEKLNLARTSGTRAVVAKDGLVDLIWYASQATQDLILDGVSSEQTLITPTNSVQHPYTVSGLARSPGTPPIRRYSLAGVSWRPRPSDLFGPSPSSSSITKELLNNAMDIDLSSSDLSRVSAGENDDDDDDYDAADILGHPDFRTWKARTINLSDARVGDENLQYLANRCPRLERINLTNTAVTSRGVAQLIERCPYLTAIDLTSCRGVAVRERRNAFEFLSDQEDGGGPE